MFFFYSVFFAWLFRRLNCSLRVKNAIAIAHFNIKLVAVFGWTSELGCWNVHNILIVFIKRYRKHRGSFLLNEEFLGISSGLRPGGVSSNYKATRNWRPYFPAYMYRAFPTCSKRWGSAIWISRLCAQQTHWDSQLMEWMNVSYKYI
jgi:hypothetical protein